MFQEYYEKAFLRGSPPEMPEAAIVSIPVNVPFKEDFNMSGRIKIFGQPFKYYRKNIDWQLDLFTKKKFPMKFPKSINIQDKSNISARAVWEKNRMQFLTVIAANYQLRKNPKDLKIFKSIIRSWISQNPYMVGINWYSSIEINIRLIVWFFCWNILDVEKLIQKDDDFREFVVKEWLPCIYLHCDYSYRNPSKNDSTSTHLISEYTGLFLAGTLWKFPQSEVWLHYAKNGLEEEILKQHSGNGVNMEQAAGSVQFITDLFLLPFIIGKNVDFSFSEAYEDRLKKIIHYICHSLDTKGNFPKYGDDDDGKCLLFSEDSHFNNFRSIVRSGAILFNDPGLNFDGELDIKNQILFNNKRIKKFETLGQTGIKPESAFYNEDGHFVFRSYANQKEIFLHFNAAPLGAGNTAAHGHADALSFILHIDGNPFFVDPGTYVYHTEYEWRKYFMGTLAHNTVKVNLNNQATIAGPNVWLNHYQTTLLNTEFENNIMRVKAQHDGYKKLGVIHLREIIFDKSKSLIRIIDTLECKNPGLHFIELPFHLHPRTIVKQNNHINFQVADEEEHILYLVIDKKLQTKIVKGQVEPQILGWYSDSFMQKEPCTTVYCAAYIERTETFQTIILIK